MDTLNPYALLVDNYSKTQKSAKHGLVWILNIFLDWAKLKSCFVIIS